MISVISVFWETNKKCNSKIMTLNKQKERRRKKKPNQQQLWNIISELMKPLVLSLMLIRAF